MEKKTYNNGNREMHFTKDNSNTPRKRNYKTYITEFGVWSNYKTKANELVSSALTLLSTATFDVLSTTVMCSNSLLGLGDKGKTKLGFINKFETSVEAEKFSITVYSDFTEAFKKIKKPAMKIIVRTDRKTGEAVQLMGFEIIDMNDTASPKDVM